MSQAAFGLITLLFVQIVQIVFTDGKIDDLCSSSEYKLRYFWWIPRALWPSHTARVLPRSSLNFVDENEEEKYSATNLFSVTKMRCWRAKIKIKLRWALFFTYTIIQSITSSEMFAFNPSKCTHTWSSRQPTLRLPGSSWWFGALLKSHISVVDDSCRSQNLNPQPRITSPTLYPLSHDCL